VVVELLGGAYSFWREVIIGVVGVTFLFEQSIPEFAPPEEQSGERRQEEIAL
jgi:hypothetical protein